MQCARVNIGREFLQFFSSMQLPKLIMPDLLTFDTDSY